MKMMVAGNIGQHKAYMLVDIASNKVVFNRDIIVDESTETFQLVSDQKSDLKNDEDCREVQHSTKLCGKKAQKERQTIMSWCGWRA